jgi:hypothetical protein
LFIANLQATLPVATSQATAATDATATSPAKAKSHAPTPSTPSIPSTPDKAQPDTSTNTAPGKSGDHSKKDESKGKKQK